uniref:Uncharacterized protein n=1 Tax=Tanacetum cinerariifolium TaxID=118510 RepID=A0A6L2MML3_TANCI|nr:hypothetical protein [Tanacetum cinerariifolium]
MAATGPGNVVASFVNQMRDEADAIRSCIGQTTAVIIELQAIEDQDEVHDSLLAAKDAKRGKENKLLALHEVGDGVIVCHLLWWLCPYGDRVMEITKLCYVCDCYTDHELFSLMHECVVLDMCDLVYGWQINSCRIWVTITKDWRLIAKLEALGQRVDVLRGVEMWRYDNGFSVL